jgi:hypothetical protein
VGGLAYMPGWNDAFWAITRACRGSTEYRIELCSDACGATAQRELTPNRSQYGDHRSGYGGVSGVVRVGVAHPAQCRPIT